MFLNLAFELLGWVGLGWKSGGLGLGLGLGLGWGCGGGGWAAAGGGVGLGLWLGLGLGAAGGPAARAPAALPVARVSMIANCLREGRSGLVVWLTPRLIALVALPGTSRYGWGWDFCDWACTLI